MPSQLFFACLASLFLSGTASAGDRPDPADWEAVLQEAQGQEVYFHAWGGDPRRNAFIGWAADQVAERHGVSVTQVKLADTGEAVSQVVAAKAAGRDSGGTVDLIWINGPNFAAMKKQGLLFGPWAEQLPNWKNVDVEGKPGVRSDFTVSTEGLEAPWNMAQIIFYHDTARLAEPPRDLQSLLDWIADNPGRFTYPAPPDFLGLTFLKQALVSLTEDPELLQDPPSDAVYSDAAAPLWAWLDAATPDLWRSGQAYPATSTQLKQLLGDGEIGIAFSFNQAEASAGIANEELPDTVRSYVLDGGTIGNASFVAIPYNAAATAGAMVFADFLMSPEAQAQAQDPNVLGAFTVLDLKRLDAADWTRFDDLDRGVATLSVEELGQALPEPHPGWMERLALDWSRRYGIGQ